PGITESTQIRLDYLMDFLLPPLYYMFLRSLYPADFGKRFGWAAMAYAIFGIACELALPARIFTWLRTSVEVVGVIVLSTCFALLIRAGIRHREGALFLAINTFMLSLVVVYDIAHREHLVLARRDLFPFGLVLMICSHGALLGSRMTKALNTSEQLSASL